MTLLSIIQTIGIVAVLGAFLYIGRKLQVLDHLEKTTEKIKNNVKVVCDHLTSVSGTAFDNGKLQNYSPVNITKVGEAYLEQLGFTEVFEKNPDDFYDFIEGEQASNDYDIENAAIRSVSALFNEPYFKPVKDYLYNHPKENKAEFFQVAGIYVRNQYQAWKKALQESSPNRQS